MTIGVGFLATDGVVICSDTQITWAGSHKCYETKIHIHQFYGWSAIFTFAGDPEVMKSFNGKFEDAVPAETPKEIGHVENLIEMVLGLLPNPEQLQMLCGISIPSWGILALLKTSGQNVRQVSHYEYVGVGDSSLLRFLSRILVDSSRRYSSDYGFMVGTYLVSQAMAHIDGCGGDVDAMILRPDGSIEHKSDLTYGVEQRFLAVQHFVSIAAKKFFVKEVPDAEFLADLRRLEARLVSEHLEMQVRLSWQPRPSASDGSEQ